MGRLLRSELVDLLKQVHNLQTSSMKKDFESLDRQLRRMDDVLFKMSQTQQDHDLDRHDGHSWAIDAWELSYDMEDTIDKLLLSIDQGPERIANRDTFRETLEDIKVKVKNLGANRAGDNFVTTTSTADPCLEYGFLQVRQLVGIHKLRDELMSTISSSSQRLKKVSIWGAAGMGKTTLAKQVYDNIKGEFNCSAFVSVGQQRHDMKKALRDILIDLGNRDLNMTILDERQLIDELRHFLTNKRFLIAVDDIRDMQSWEKIECALIDSGCGSRIITTSRIVDIAEMSGEVVKLMPLSINDSEELFYDTLYGHKVPITFYPLDKYTEYSIMQKCGGIPLAVITVASLLAGKPQVEWTKVYNSIGFEKEDNIDAENTRKIIQFSYYDLPSHLKTCLLYLSIFIEDHTIEKDMLVWRWVAEGFVHEEQAGESLFKVGERYLYELIVRSMIQPVQNEDTNMLSACRVHNMVLDFIRTVAKEENFVDILDWYDHDHHLSYQSNACILAAQNRVLEKHDLTRMCKPKVRSFSGTGCHIGSMMLLLPSFQFLRVLSLEDCEILPWSPNECNSDYPPGQLLFRVNDQKRIFRRTEVVTADGLKNLVGLLHLRYLAIRGMNFGDLLTEMGDLRFLQTLDLMDSIEALPQSVTQLRQLKCLRYSGLRRRLELPKGMGKLTSLEELQLGAVNISPDLASELSKLTELRVLRICIGLFGDEDMEALVKSLSEFQKMEELELLCDVPRSHRPCCHIIAPGGFPKLRYLRMYTWVMYRPGAMPCLKSVHLTEHMWAAKCATFTFDFHNFYKLVYLRLLEKVHIGINCSGVKMEQAEAAEATLGRIIQSHPNRPKLTVTRSGWYAEDKIHSRVLHGSQVAPVMIPLELLRKITNDFSDKQKIGCGTFGKVYKGVHNGKEIAVKLLQATQRDCEEEFKKELVNHRGLKHPNIVQLLGYCYEIKREFVEHEGRSILADNTYRALCFEYMDNGNLQRHLDDESHGLDWQTRYKIIKGTCEGLKYLHEGLVHPMYHLDLKPGNILLGKNMVPKLADFGISKLVYDNQTHCTINFCGTIRYCPPERIERNYFSNKSDIFSLGVVMIEIIAGPEGYSKAAEMPSPEFIDHVQENWRKRLDATPDCASPIHECCQVKRCIEIALACILHDRKQRPEIGDITSWLNETENNTDMLATTSTSRNGDDDTVL